MPDGSPSIPDSSFSPSPHSKLRFVNLITPGRLDLEFVYEAAKGLRFLMCGRGETTSNAKREIFKTFAGVCLAAPNDSYAARVALEQIKELDVHAVRIDCSEATDAIAFKNLLESLKNVGVGVLLHLVQPLQQARLMPASQAVESWKHFVEGMLVEYSGYIEAVEIGTTINRAKWAGYRLEGFLAAWETAYPLIRNHGLPLVGPNVTDFEPQYNTGILGMLKRRSVLPDIHSNNMFAERAIEPEALDRKILGEKWKHLHGYDLIKKLSRLVKIAQGNGVLRSWSTCAFWTLPRIERILVNAEEQMADYLVRYYVLCASEGSFERFYWGPLVGRREGLLDDGTGLPEDRSVRDVVAYYRELPGAADQWQRRRAFNAFKTMNGHLLGARYRARLCGQNGLEVHAFEKGAEQFHVVWTKNGALARINDLYSAQDLESVSAIISRDGDELDEWPDYFSESPVYLVWRDSPPVEVALDAGVVPQLVAVRAQSGGRYFAYRSGEWRGTVHARSRQEADSLIKALKPESITSPEKGATLRNARNVIWTIEDPLDTTQSLVVKKPVRVAWHKRIFDRKKPSKSLRSWNGTSELQRRGIETPKVVAYFEHEDRSRVLDNWFVCEHAGTRLSVRGFFSAFARGEEKVEGYTFEAFSGQLVEFIRNVHWRGVYFRDLSGGNVLVSIQEGGGLAFSLIDTARARFANQRFSRSKRIADLKRLVHKLDPERQEAFVQAYLDKERARFTGWHRLAFRIYALKAALKRTKRKLRKDFSSK